MTDIDNPNKPFPEQPQPQQHPLINSETTTIDTLTTTTNDVNPQQVVDAALATFQALGITGKPQPHEYTVLAAIALSFNPDPSGLDRLPHNIHTTTPLPPLPTTTNEKTINTEEAAEEQLQGVTEFRLVSLATGTKCLPASARTACGAAVNDMHAEVLCRRSLVRWLMEEIEAAAAIWIQHHMPRHGGDSGVGGTNRGGKEEEHEKQQDVDKQQQRYVDGTRILRLVPPPTISSDSYVSKHQEGSDGGEEEDCWAGWKIELQPNVALHMFTSQLPCGDASIVEQQHCQQQQHVCSDGDNNGIEQRGVVDVLSTANDTTVGTASRTGAKRLILPDTGTDTTKEDTEHAHSGGGGGGVYKVPTAQDVEKYEQLQETGVIRRKPGKGEPTLSMSCSDKLAKWQLLGLQGALLSNLFTTPLTLHSFTVTTPTTATTKTTSTATTDSQQQQQQDSVTAALQRALIDRVKPLQHIVNNNKTTTSSGSGNTTTTHHHQQQQQQLSVAAVPIPTPHLQQLGLLQSLHRTSACGTSIVWRAPASTHWKPHRSFYKNLPSLSLTTQLQPPLPPSTAGDGTSGTTGVSTSTKWLVLSGGVLETLSGATGIRLGVSRKNENKKGGDGGSGNGGGGSIKAGARIGVCKAEILGAFIGLRRVIRSLHNNNSHRQNLQKQQHQKYQDSVVVDGSGGDGINNNDSITLLGNKRDVQGNTIPTTSTTVDKERTYREWKKVAGGQYLDTWRLLLQPLSLFEGWIPKPAELEQFTFLQ